MGTGAGAHGDTGTDILSARAFVCAVRATGPTNDNPYAHGDRGTDQPVPQAPRGIRYSYLSNFIARNGAFAACFPQDDRRVIRRNKGVAGGLCLPQGDVNSLVRRDTPDFPRGRRVV